MREKENINAPVSSGGDEQSSRPLGPIGANESTPTSSRVRELIDKIDNIPIGPQPASSSAANPDEAEFGSSRSFSPLPDPVLPKENNEGRPAWVGGTQPRTWRNPFLTETPTPEPQNLPATSSSDPRVEGSEHLAHTQSVVVTTGQPSALLQEIPAATAPQDRLPAAPAVRAATPSTAVPAAAPAARAATSSQQPAVPHNSRAATPAPELQTPPAAPTVQETGNANSSLSDDVFFEIAKALRDAWNGQRAKRITLAVSDVRDDAVKNDHGTVKMSFNATITVPVTMPGQQPTTENTGITLSRTIGADGKVERRIDCATTLSMDEQFALLAKAAFLEHGKAGKPLRIDVALKNMSGTAQPGQLTADERKLVDAYIAAGFHEVHCQGIARHNANVRDVNESVLPAVVAGGAAAVARAADAPAAQPPSQTTDSTDSIPGGPASGS